LSFTEKQLKLKTDELISKTIKINEANRALAVANQKLESKTTELNNNNKSLFESNREIAEIYNELAETNKAFAKLNQESTTLNKELALAYQKIEQQNQTYEAFINIAAHELRTPAQSILGYAEIAKNDPAYKEDKEGYLHVIFRNAFRLDKLIKNILDVTKIEGNTLHLDKQRFNLNDILLSVLEDTKTQILANDSKLKLSLSLDKSSSTSSVAEKHDELISVEADRERITQVLYNLLDNAIKFSKEGTISVRIERKRNNEDAKDVIVIGIKDTGSGIHAEIMPKLFSKFASKSVSGTGLGLYISKSIVEAHGGRIWAENNPDGKGASFSFSLPLD
jgi:signal transduction histidine kinase